MSLPCLRGKGWGGAGGPDLGSVAARSGDDGGGGDVLAAAEAVAAVLPHPWKHCLRLLLQRVHAVAAAAAECRHHAAWTRWTGLIPEAAGAAVAEPAALSDRDDDGDDGDCCCCPHAAAAVVAASLPRLYRARRGPLSTAGPECQEPCFDAAAPGMCAMHSQIDNQLGPNVLVVCVDSADLSRPLRAVAPLPDPLAAR